MLEHFIVLLYNTATMATGNTDKPTRYFPGDIVIPAQGMTESTREHLLFVLGEFDIPAATVGLQPLAPANEPDRYTHLYEEVTQWQEVNGPHIRTDLLEPVLPLLDIDPPAPRSDDEAVPMLTLGTINSALYAIEPHPRSAPIRAGKLHIHIGDAVAELRDQRQYIHEGSAYLGTRPSSPGYRWERPHWAITPAALYGLTQEDPLVGLGLISRNRAGQILDHLVQQPPASMDVPEI
jgi:hypothetical protein